MKFLFLILNFSFPFLLVLDRVHSRCKQSTHCQGIISWQRYLSVYIYIFWLVRWSIRYKGIICMPTKFHKSFVDVACAKQGIKRSIRKLKPRWAGKQWEDRLHKRGTVQSCNLISYFRLVHHGRESKSPALVRLSDSKKWSSSCWLSPQFVLK